MYMVVVLEELLTPGSGIVESVEVTGPRRAVLEGLEMRFDIGVVIAYVGAAMGPGDAEVSKSAVSRRFVAATESALAELMTADLSGLDLVAIMVDGVHFAQHLCVVALGIGI